MRTIYWKRYGVIVPLLVFTGILGTIGIVVRIALKSSKTDVQGHEHKRSHHDEKSKDTKNDKALSDNDFAELVRRPDLDDIEDDDWFDDELVTDPEDSQVDAGDIGADPDNLQGMEQVGSTHGELDSGEDGHGEEKSYTTEAPSDLVEDDEGHGYSKTESSTKMTKKKRRKAAKSKKKKLSDTTLSPLTDTTDGASEADMTDTTVGEDITGGIIGADMRVGTAGADMTVGTAGSDMAVGTAGADMTFGTAGMNMPEMEDFVGAQDYQDTVSATDFQDGPLTADEEYALHLNDDEIIHAREGMHPLDILKDAYPPSADDRVQDTPGSVYQTSDAEEAAQVAYPRSHSAQVSQGTVHSVGDGWQQDVPLDDNVQDYVMEDDDYTLSVAGKADKHPYVPPENPMNVLFIVMDDLRPQLGAYEGRDYGAMNDAHKMYTPHIDKLASESLVLKRAYAQYSMCGPSRASLMTSRRPDVTKAYQNYVYWRYWSVGNFSTIPQYFKDHGYATLGAGKIFHVDLLPKDYDPPSWSLPYFRPRPSEYDRNTSVNWAAVPEDATEPLVDENTADYAVQKMAQLASGANNGKPFFFAVGFNQPHFRHICPAKFFEYYPLEKKKCMFQESWQTPPYIPRTNLAPLVEGVNNTDLTHIPSIPMREIRRAYFACVSYVDSLVGKLVQGLEDSGLADSTVVTLVSDHGYHLGDNDMFGTYSNHEMALHVPLIIKIPGKTNRGIESRSLVELIDVFPTLAEAVGLPPVIRCPDRSSEIQVCTDGVSLIPLISRPKLYVKDAVFAQLQRGRSLTEYTIRTNKYRLVDLALHRRTMLYPGVYQHELDFDLDLRGRRHGRRLYDLTKDPLETVNRADDPAYADTLARLRAKLRHTFVNVYDYSKFLFHSFPE